ncbi:MAG: phosphoribosylglycinamide formyltransferase [Burkholderiales bacterium]|nr:phosphoribosylglycinamide formyltransferase [Burkholderiales bacterium]
MVLKRIAILISGRGSNMEALLKAGLPAQVCAVISNDPAAKGLASARSQGLPVLAIDHKAHATRESFDAALAAAIDASGAELVVLAGFMRVLTAGFVEHYRGRLINIHPSLLPSFKGLHTHRQALDAGVRVHGCTVHFVTPELDHGPVIIQAAVPVLQDDDEAHLAARVLAEEHRIYPQAVRWLCEGRVRLHADGRVEITNAAAAGGALHSPPLQ